MKTDMEGVLFVNCMRQNVICIENCLVIDICTAFDENFAHFH
jgi:hypothetical protein